MTKRTPLLTTNRPTKYLNETWHAPALQRKLNNKLVRVKKTDKIDFRYKRLRCSVPQPPKLYGLPKLHKPNCGFPTYQLSKYLTNVLKPLTEESGHKLQPTENFIDAIKTIQIADDHNWTSVFWREITVHQYATSTGSRLYWERYFERTLRLNYHCLQTTLWTYWLRRTFSTNANTTNSYTVQLWAPQFLLL